MSRRIQNANKLIASVFFPAFFSFFTFGSFFGVSRAEEKIGEGGKYGKACLRLSNKNIYINKEVNRGSVYKSVSEAGVDEYPNA